jgi:hypothetical protein
MIMVMAIGQAIRQESFDDALVLVGDQLPETSLYRLLACHGQALFPDDYFVDLFKRSARGRPTVPARTVATVMLLQAHEGLSDREACDRLTFDLRWKAAAGLAVSSEAFHSTVLVGMRNRLRASGRPRRLFEDVNATARAAGLLAGRRRVLDSTLLFDAVATQDTVVQLRAAIRKLLDAADRVVPEIAAAVRASLSRDDDYASLGKPPCDWDDPAAREALVDALVTDAHAALAVLHDGDLPESVTEVAKLLALVAGQDVEPGGDGIFRIARKVARDRVISTVDTEARHGHKSRARRFDGYKAHLGVDPDDELITNVAVTPANASDREAIDELLAEPAYSDTAENSGTESIETDTTSAGTGTVESAGAPGSSEPESPVGQAGFEVYGDSAYADGQTLADQAERGNEWHAKVPPVRNTRGYSKDEFRIDPESGTVTCPAGHTVAIRRGRRGSGHARFGQYCSNCPLRDACTKARRGRAINIHPHEDALQHAKAAQQDPAWQQTYRANRPTVERKIAHFTRRSWGGRNARCRGQTRILTDILARAGALNLARLASLGLHQGTTGWAIA